MANNRSSYFLGTTISFLVGSGTGFILGILFAPAKGEETRKKIQKGAVKTGEKAKESYKKISKEVEKGIGVVKEKTHDGIDSIKEFVEKSKEEIMKKFPRRTVKEKVRKK